MVEVARGKVRRVGWTSVTPGAHVATTAPELRDALRAWHLVLPATAAFTHLTAAALRGWWLPAPVPRPVFVSVVPAGPPSRSDAACRSTRCGAAAPSSRAASR